MNERDIQKLHARSSAYRLLAVFMALPNEEVACGVVEGAVRADLADILDEAGLDQAEQEAVLAAYDGAGADDLRGDAVGVLEQLRRDYTRLFTNPERAIAAPYEAVFKRADDFESSGLTFISPTALDARRLYRELGLDMSTERHESPDHMAAECDFASYAYRELASSLQEGDEARAAEVERVLRDFMSGHLLKWGSDFFALVSERAATPVYRAMGTMGMLLVRKERWAAE